MSRAEFDPEFAARCTGSAAVRYPDLCRGVRRDMVEVIVAVNQWIYAAGRLADRRARLVRGAELMRREAEQVTGDGQKAFQALQRAAGRVVTMNVHADRTPESRAARTAVERLRWAATSRIVRVPQAPAADHRVAVAHSETTG